MYIRDTDLQIISIFFALEFKLTKYNFITSTLKMNLINLFIHLKKKLY